MRSRAGRLEPRRSAVGVGAFVPGCCCCCSAPPLLFVAVAAAAGARNRRLRQATLMSARRTAARGHRAGANSGLAPVRRAGGGGVRRLWRAADGGLGGHARAFVLVQRRETIKGQMEKGGEEWYAQPSERRSAPPASPRTSRSAAKVRFTATVKDEDPATKPSRVRAGGVRPGRRDRRAAARLLRRRADIGRSAEGLALDGTHWLAVPRGAGEDGEQPAPWHAAMHASSRRARATQAAAAAPRRQPTTSNCTPSFGDGYLQN